MIMLKDIKNNESGAKQTANSVFLSYTNSIKKKERILLTEKILHLITLAVHESMKAKKNNDYIALIEKSKEIDEELEYLLKTECDWISTLITTIIYEPYILGNCDFKTSLEETMVDLIEVKQNIKDKIKEDFQIFCEDLNLSRKNLSPITLTREQIREIFQYCTEEINFKRIISNRILSNTFLDSILKESESIISKETKFLITNQKEKFLNEVKFTLESLGKNIRTVDAFKLIVYEILNGNPKNEELYNKLVSLKESVNGIREDLTLLILENFFEITNKDIDEKIGQIEYEIYGSNSSLINALDSILNSIEENIEKTNIVLSVVKEILEVNEFNDKKMDEICSLRELANQTYEKAKKVLTDHNIRIKTQSAFFNLGYISEESSEESDYESLPSTDEGEKSEDEKYVINNSLKEYKEEYKKQ